MFDEIIYKSRFFIHTFTSILRYFNVFGGVFKKYFFKIYSVIPLPNKVQFFLNYLQMKFLSIFSLLLILSSSMTFAQAPEEKHLKNI